MQDFLLLDLFSGLGLESAHCSWDNVAKNGPLPRSIPLLEYKKTTFHYREESESLYSWLLVQHLRLHVSRPIIIRRKTILPIEVITVPTPAS